MARPGTLFAYATFLNFQFSRSFCEVAFYVFSILCKFMAKAELRVNLRRTKTQKSLLISEILTVKIQKTINSKLNVLSVCVEI